MINIKPDILFFPIRLFVWLCCILLIPVVSHAQSGNQSEYKVKAVFIYNFTRFVEWPAEKFNDASAPFIIGVYGKDAVSKFLEEAVAGETLQGRPIQVQKISNLQNINNCHLVFLSNSEKDEMKAFISEAGNNGILTVSDADKFTENGGMIRLFTRHGKIGIQINAEKARAAGLGISSKLLSLAKTE